MEETVTIRYGCRGSMGNDPCLTDVVRYLDQKRHLNLDDMLPEYEGYLRILRRFSRLTPETNILEIGTGTGWFPLLCRRDGYQCKGLEISQQLIDYAKDFGRRYGLEPDIELGNIEETDVGVGVYDAIFANSVFEHVQRWQIALERVYRALKPGGVLFFASTNKFSLISDEYKFPLYGWLPDAWRYRLRVARQGADIMKLGIDFNQFTYPQLRREFRRIGFSRIYDRVEVADPERYAPWQRAALKLVGNSRLIKAAVLLFSRATVFVCVR